jgi:hypothetical protein
MGDLTQTFPCDPTVPGFFGRGWRPQRRSRYGLFAGIASDASAETLLKSLGEPGRSRLERVRIVRLEDDFDVGTVGAEAWI